MGFHSGDGNRWMISRSSGFVAAFQGVAAAVRSGPGLFVVIATGVLALDVFLPPLVLSLVRKPWTFFMFNPWLKKLPEYLGSDAPPGQKLDFLSRVALFWFTADGPFGVPEWGFAVDTMDVLRFLGMSLLVATYFVLWLYRREHGALAGLPGHATRAGGVAGAAGGGAGGPPGALRGAGGGRPGPPLPRP